ncbi:MAG: hypothetical protein HY549_04885 [Elusimicrobia bacterium]|nr:hypothetical protein [Elusimicrobiota bacterium]
MPARIALSLALSALAAQFEAPITVTSLSQTFIESVDEGDKRRALDHLARIPIMTARDAQSAHDLFVRFPDRPVREAVLASLERMDRQNQALGSFFLRCLQDPEPESALFGLRGALRLRHADALPAVRSLAKRKFAFAGPQEAPLISDKNAWWLQYEALSALAQWEGSAALDLLVKQSRRAPAVAQIMARYLWKESLPLLARWSASRSNDDLERAREGLSTVIPLDAIQAGYEPMLAWVRDPKAPRLLRHQLALKLGLAASDEQVDSLIKEHADLADPETRLMFEAALFASRHPKVIPVLVRYAKENPNPSLRAGARAQLKDMMDPKEYRELLEWLAANDPDPENRREITEELKPAAR